MFIHYRRGNLDPRVLQIKHSLDSAILTLRRKTRTQIKSDSDEIGPLAPWTFHDLRRTAATIMARHGAPPVERVLNHASGTISRVAKIYNRYQYLDERRAALESLAEHIKRISST
jgi:integrase